MSLAAMQTRQASAQTEQGAAGLCRDCASFSSSAAALEQAFPGLTSMGSGFGSVRWGDGLCAVHGRYLSCVSSCGSFARR